MQHQLAMPSGTYSVPLISPTIIHRTATSARHEPLSTTPNSYSRAIRSYREGVILSGAVLPAERRISRQPISPGSPRRLDKGGQVKRTSSLRGAMRQMTAEVVHTAVAKRNQPIEKRLARSNEVPAAATVTT